MPKRQNIMSEQRQAQAHKLREAASEKLSTACGQLEAATSGYRHSISLPNDVNEIPRLAAFIDDVCNAMHIDGINAMGINLAMEEAVVNVMEYAYPKGTKGDVHIEVHADEKELHFVISDSGMPFDPTKAQEVDITLSVEERGIGGLGIHLVRTYMDDISYERLNGQNILTLTKVISVK